VNAWCEVVAMISSFGVSVALLLLRKAGVRFDTHEQLLITVIVTTVCWLATAYLAPSTDRQTLIEFYRKVRPFGPGWRPVRLEAGVSDAEAALYAQHENIPLSLLGWALGCMSIWSSLFAVGNFLYGRTSYALALLAIFVVSSLLLVRVIQRLWK
jgi:hypothetical protein